MPVIHGVSDGEDEWLDRIARAFEDSTGALSAQDEKGGAGSGHHRHGGGRGGPGNPGGSRPRGAAGGAGGEPKEAFSLADWNAMDVPDRFEKWNGMSVSERDKLADAESSVGAYQSELLSYAGDRPEFAGDVSKSIDQRLGALAKENGEWVVPEANATMIGETVHEMDGWLEKAGVDPEARYRLGMEAADTLYAQDRESLGRTLGDHGVHHLRGNIQMSTDILEEHPSPDTAQQMAEVYVAQVFHDTGYLAGPSRVFLDEGHPRWSAQHYNANLQPLVKDALGSRGANEVGHIIRTHDGTTIDWKEDTVASAIRVSDNLAIFHREKLPGLIREVPANAGVLDRLAAKEIDAKTARGLMRSNVNSAGLPKPVRTQLLSATNEVSDVTPKFVLGMLGGEVNRVEWKDQGLDVYLRRQPQQDNMHKVLDLGQRQFGKLAKAYGNDPEDFTRDLSFEFSTQQGDVLLRGVIEAQKMLQKLLRSL